MKKKTSWLKIITILTAVAGAVVAVSAYLKKKSKRLSEELDFDNSLYFDEDSDMMDDDDYAEEIPAHQEASFAENDTVDSDIEEALEEDADDEEETI